MGYVSIGTKAVGSIVKLKENGVWADYLIVHQGLPDSMYDASCNGTWVLRKDIFEKYSWNVADRNDYASSPIKAYLDSTVLSRFDSDTQDAIKTVKIPYCINNSNQYGVVRSGADGLPCKVFLLSGYETGLESNQYLPEDGVKLSYFTVGASAADNDKRIARLNGRNTEWLLRSPATSGLTFVWCVASNGSASNAQCNLPYGYRPALVLPPSLFVGDDGTVTTNSAPGAPVSITVPDSARGGALLTVSWGAASDPDGNLAGYKLERSVNGGAWAQVYAGTALSFTDAITFGWASVAYRVKAYDAVGFESGYAASPTRTVRNNYAPVISGSDGGLGSFAAAPPVYAYSVTDANGDAVTAKVYLDGTLKQTFNPTLGSNYNLTFSAADWRKVLNGSHTWRIDADDHDGGTASRTVTFVKAVTQIKFTTGVMAADAMPAKAVINYTGYIAPGAVLTVEICNNGGDAAPAWEDCTDKALHGKKHFFANTAKTAAAWGVALRVTIDRGGAAETSFLSQIGGNFG